MKIMNLTTVNADKNKHVKSFEELNENKNLNISDVSDSITKEEYKVEKKFCVLGKLVPNL